MYHWNNNWYFGRRKDGSVRIVRVQQRAWPEADGEFTNAEFDMTIDADSWASIVSSVSLKGEAHNHDLAKFLHSNAL